MMNKRELIDRFNSDVDHLLYEATLTQPKPASPEYDQMIELAQQLTTTDFSRQSKIRALLRRRLLNRIDRPLVVMAEVPGPPELIKQLFQPGQLFSYLQRYARLWSHKFILAGLAGLLLVFSLMAWSYLPDLPVGQKLTDLLAQVLAYFPAKRAITPHTFLLRWQFRDESGVSSPPAVANSFVYVGSNSGYLYALDTQTGREQWRFKTGDSLDLAPTATSEIVYAAGDDGYLYALDSHTGREKWRFQGDGPFSSGPAITTSTIFAGTNSGYLYALDAQTGQKKWQFRTGNAILPTTAVTGNILYIGSQDHYLYALDAQTGQERWRFDAGDWISTTPVEVAGLVYVGSYDENLYVLDAATGLEQWHYKLDNAVRTSATLAGGIIYFGGYDSYLHAVDGATGQEKWRFKMNKQTRSTPVVVGEVIYIGSGDGYLYEVDARAGAEIARYGVDSQIYTAPAVSADTIYFVSGKGELYAIQRASLPPTEKQTVAMEDAPVENESPGFQFTPGGWYVEGKDSDSASRRDPVGDKAIRFRGRMLDGTGRPVNGFSVQADNGTKSILSAPSGPNRWQPAAAEGEWEIVIPIDEGGVGWWWLTTVRYECPLDPIDFDPHCPKITRLSESVKVEVASPDETIIDADWTCHWACQQPDKNNRKTP